MWGERIRGRSDLRPLEASVLLEIDSLSLGFIVSPRLEVGCELVVERGRFESTEDRKDDRPQIGRPFEGACKQPSGSVGKVIVRFICEELGERVEIFELVGVAHKTV